MKDMIVSEGWEDLDEGEEAAVPKVVDLTLRLALMAIATAGFGMRMKWADQSTSFDEDPIGTILPPGHRMSMQTALHCVAKYSALKIATPNVRHSLSSHLSLPTFCFSEIVGDVSAHKSPPNYACRV